MTAATEDLPNAGNGAGVWVSILYAAIAGNLFIALSPIFWAGYIDYAHFSDAVTGDLMSAEFFGATVATVAGALYMHRARLNLRSVTYVALAIYAIGNCFTPQVLDSPVQLKALRFICGLSSGTVFLATATVITSLKGASRLVAIFYGTPYITGFVLQPLMQSLFNRWGFDSAFRLIAIAAAAAAALYCFFPRYAADSTATTESTAAADSAPAQAPGAASKRSLGLLLVLSAALLLQYIANSGVWLFFDRIGTMSGHDGQTAANVVALGTGMALAGTALAALLAEKLEPLFGILSGTAIIIVSTLLLHFSASLPIYAASVLTFNMMITFLTPFYFLLLVKVYRPASAVIAGNICLMLGFSLGPLLIGHTVSHNDYAFAINSTVGLFVVSIVLVFGYRYLAERSQLPNRAALAEPGS